MFDQAGLLPYVYAQKEGQPWPTLGQMIDSGKRVVVLMENHGGGKTYPWMLQGFDWVQDTPFANPSTGRPVLQALNRGAAVRPAASDQQLAQRIHVAGDQRQEGQRRRRTRSVSSDKCRTERGQLPNYVAVNFYNEPDVFKAVDQLNGFS